MSDYALTLEFETHDHSRYIAKDTSGKIVARSGRIEGLIDVLSGHLTNKTTGRRVTIAPTANVPESAADTISKFVAGYNFLHNG